MSATTILISALVAQSAISLAHDNEPVDRVEAGYEELRAGDAHGAIAKIEANESVASQDPAALINLGNAYARVGMTEKALSHYRTAMNSDTRYELELADGRWMDSRKAARKAYQALIKSTAHVMRD